MGQIRRKHERGQPMNKIKIIKNIMKTNRSNERKQYTISIPDIIGQILEIETKKIDYGTTRLRDYGTAGLRVFGITQIIRLRRYEII